MLLAAAALSGAVTEVATAASPPNQARKSVAVLTNGRLTAAAFAIDDQGDFVTAEQAASRGVRLRLTLPGGRVVAARRRESDAPAGLALVHAAGASLPALSFAGAEPRVGDTTWTVAPRSVLPHAVRTRVEEPLTGLSKDGVLHLEQLRRPGLVGSPLVDASGRVTAVVRSSRPSQDVHVQAVVIARAPRALAAPLAPKRADFPAVAVTLGIAIALLLLAIVVRTLRLRRAAAEEMIFARPATAADAAVVSAPASRDEDPEIQVTLRRQQAQPASARRSATSPEPDDLVQLRPR